MDKRVGDILAEFRSEMESLYGDRLAHVILFGSQARGDAGPGWDSDIDVLVVLKGPVDEEEESRRTSAFVADLCLRYDRVVSHVFMDEQHFAHRNGPLLRNIRREGIPV